MRLATLGRTLPGAQDRRDDLFGGVEHGRFRVGRDLELLFLDEGAVAVFTLDQHHPDCRWCHRHTKDGVHNSPNRLLGFPPTR